MSIPGGLRRLAGGFVRALLLAPVFALVFAALFDRGSRGSIRFTLFPTALMCFDPFIWECVQNSLILAVAVTLGARLLGVALARIAVRWRFWGRPPLTALIAVGLVLPPALAALGIKQGLGPFWGSCEAALGDWAGLVAWLAWFWASLIVAVPLVAFTASNALEKVDPAWEDAARLAGAGPGRRWHRFVRPVIAPDVVRSLGLVFTLTLLEPGAPLVLGIRRSLGYQLFIAAADTSAGQLSRAVVLALGAIALAWLVRALIGRLAGRATPGFSSRAADTRRGAPAGWTRSLAFVLFQSLLAAFIWIPILGLFAAALRAIDPLSDARTSLTFARFHDLWSDELIRSYVINSAILGLTVVILVELFTRAVSSFPSRVPVKRSPKRSRLATRIEAIPPPALAVGLIALPGVMMMIAEMLTPVSLRFFIMPTFEYLGGLIDIDRTPGLALVFAVALVRLPFTLRRAELQARQAVPVKVDAALTLGATNRRARRLAAGRRPSAALLFTFILAATAITPALFLSPTAESRPIGPAVLMLIDEPNGGISRASALATIALAANVIALALASRRGSGIERDWLRG